MSKKESPLLGLQGMGGGVGGFNFLAAGGEGGGLWGWGTNKSWLFTSTPAPQIPQATPFRSSPASIGSETDWTSFTISTQQRTYTAINADSELFIWGAGYGGSLGLNQADLPSPKALPQANQLPGTWRQTASTIYCMMAIRDSDDAMFTWGQNYHGVLAQNNTNYRSSPTRVPGSWANGDIGGNDKNVSGMGVKTDGTLWMWGRNEKGKLGIPPSVPGGGPYPHEPETSPKISSPIQVGTDTTWGKSKYHISTGDGFSAAIKTDGTLWTWGNAQYGCLGLNYNSPRSSPTQIGTNTNWEQILLSGDGQRAFGVKSDNTLWAWGSQDYWGLLGLNQVGDPASHNNRSSPTQIPGSWKIGGCTNAGRSNMGWVKEDGTLWRWGANNYGEMGTNDQGPGNPENPGPWTSRSSPIQVGSGTDWLGTTGDYEMVGAWGPKP